MQFGTILRIHSLRALVFCQLAGLSGCSMLRQAIPITSAVGTPDAIRQVELSSEQQANVCLQTALQLAASEKDEHAIAQFRKARTLDPELTGIAHPLAVLYDRQGQFSFAEREYLRAMKEGRPSADLLNDFGYFRYSQGALEAATGLLTQAKAMAPDHAQATVNLAMVHAARGDTEAAVELFSQSVGSAAAHQNMGLLLLQQGKKKDALAHFEKASRLDPSMEIAAALIPELESTSVQATQLVNHEVD